MNRITDEYADLEAAVEKVRTNIAGACERANRDPSSVRLVVITKTHPSEAVGRLVETGVRDVGESYVKEFRTKYASAPDPEILWHYVGHLFRKYATKVVGRAEYIHSVDSVRLAKKIDRTADRKDISQKVLLQVNMSGENSKYGFEPAEVTKAEVVGEMGRLDRVRIRGLMTMAPYTADEGELRKVFSGLREVRDELRERSGWDLPELSMGMSNDYSVAVEEGATMVRIGTAILGERRR